MYGHANKVCCCCYTWVQMLLQIGPLLRLGSKCDYRWDFYYAWVQMLLRMGPLLHLGPVITLVPFTRNLKKRQFFRTFLFSCALYVSSRTAGALRDEASRARTSANKATEIPFSSSEPFVSWSRGRLQKCRVRDENAKIPDQLSRAFVASQ